MQLVLDQLTQLNTNVMLMFSQMQMQMSIFGLNQGQAQFQGNTQFQGNISNASQVSKPGGKDKKVKVNDVPLTDETLLDFSRRLKSIRDSGRYHRAFVRKYKYLLSFKQVYGHVKVTASMHKVLSAWVKNQRTNLGLMYRHKGPLVGRPFHVELLNEIGIYSYEDNDKDVDSDNDESGEIDVDESEEIDDTLLSIYHVCVYSYVNS
jgi:hypothetical protein